MRRTRTRGVRPPPDAQMVYLGNLDAQRDWGHARDYIEGMWLMVQKDEPDDYVLATGECHSVREFLEVRTTRGGVARSRDNHRT